MRLGIRSLSILSLLMASSRSGGQHGPEGQALDHQWRGTIFGTVITAFGEAKLRNVSVYVYTLAQSRRLREMDENAYKRAHAPGIANDEAGAIESRGEDALADQIPKLPRTAKGKSDNRGVFAFRNLPTGRRYCLVALDIAEDGIFLAAIVTPMLKDGQELKVDLRDDAGGAYMPVCGMCAIRGTAGSAGAEHKSAIYPTPASRTMRRGT